MADATEFNLADGIEAQRKLLYTLVNVGTSETPVWQLVGAGIEDSSIEYNTDKTKTTDILGLTHTKVNRTEPTQSLTPYTVVGGDALQVKLYNQMRNQEYAEMSDYEVLIVHGYVGTADTAMESELHAGCTISIDSVGGSSYVDMPITIDFSNEKTLGTTAVAAGVFTFTPNA